MSGTKAGGLKAAATNKALHGENFYSLIGAKGGRLGRTGGFAANPKLAQLAGAKGGRISKRGKAKQPYHIQDEYLRKMKKQFNGVTVGDVLNGHIAVDVTDKVHFVKETQ